MATYTGFLAGGTTGHPNSSWVRQPYFVETVIDFSKQNASGADVYRCINVPAETLIMHCSLEVITALTVASSPTLDLEVTGGTANQWLAAGTKITTGYETVVDDAANLTTRLVTSDDTIDLLVNTGTITAGIVRVWALLLDVSGIQEAFTGADATTTA